MAFGPTRSSCRTIHTASASSTAFTSLMPRTSESGSEGGSARHVRRVFVDPEAPQSDAIQEAATWIRRGGVTAIPTDTLYGLAANPFDANAVARVFQVKGRPTDRALPLIASDLAQVVRHIGPLPSRTERLVTRFWPGPLTLLFAAPAALPSRVTGGTHRVGV